MSMADALADCAQLLVAAPSHALKSKLQSPCNAHDSRDDDDDDPEDAPTDTTPSTAASLSPRSFDNALLPSTLPPPPPPLIPPSALVMSGDACTLTDLPPDILHNWLLPHVPRGHRLDVRAVSRAWKAWADACLVAGHINIVCERPQLQRALQRARAASGSGGGGGSPCEVALLDSLEHAGRWLVASSGSANCTQCASSDLDAGLLQLRFGSHNNVRLWVGCRPPAPLAGRNGGGPAAAAAAAVAAAATAPRTSRTFYTSGTALARSALAALSYTATAALAAAAGALAPSAEALTVAVVQAGRRLRRLPPLPRAAIVGRRRPPPPGLDLQWHPHPQLDAAPGRGGRGVPLLRRFPPEPREPCLPPLATVLPLLGCSTRLTALSLVVAHQDVGPEDLALLAAAFPRLRALALHAAVDTVAGGCMPVRLPSLDALCPTCESSTFQQRPQQPQHDERPAGGATLQWLPLAPPPPQPQPPLVVSLHSLVLAGMHCDWAHERGLQHLTRLRSLVLHRVTCRAWALLPQVQALTQLTRLELRRLDYHDAAAPLSAEDRAARDARLRWRHARAAEEKEEALAQQRDASDAPAASAAAAEAAAQAAAEAGYGDEPAGPWLRHAPYGYGPDWPATMRALGRTVRGMAELRVLVCDAEPTGRDAPDAWRALLASVCRLSNLAALRLPHLQLASFAQAARLAAALPQLAALELAALPDAQPADLQRLRLPEQKELRRWAGALRAHCLDLPCAEPPVEVGAGGGSGQQWAAATREEREAVAAALCGRGGVAPWLQGGEAGSDGGGAGRSSGSSGSSSRDCSMHSACSASHGGSGGGGACRGSGLLARFSALRELRLHSCDVRSLAVHGVPLPLRLADMDLHLRTGDCLTRPQDLPLLAAPLLPALASLSRLRVALGGLLAGSDGVALAALLSRAPGLEALDLMAATHPSTATGAEVAAALRRLAEGAPRLRRLACYVHVHDGQAAHGAARPSAAGPPPRPAGAPAAAGPSGRAAADPAQSWVSPVLDAHVVAHLNALPRLDELRVRAVSAGSCACGARRVPLELPLALRRGVRVVDCQPLDVWSNAHDALCSRPSRGHGSTDDAHAEGRHLRHPLGALREARARLAAARSAATLVAEAEEWAVEAAGLGDGMDRKWRAGGVL